MIERTSGTDVWYGAGALWKSISIPTARLIRPDDRQRAVRDHVRVDHEQRDPEQDQREPAHEIGSTEKPKSAVRSETPPSAPGQHDAGMEDLEADAGDAREEEQARGGSGRSACSAGA